MFAKKTIVISAHGEVYPKNNICNMYIKNTNFETIKEGNKQFFKFTRVYVC